MRLIESEAFGFVRCEWVYKKCREDQRKSKLLTLYPHPIVGTVQPASRRPSAPYFLYNIDYSRVRTHSLHHFLSLLMTHPVTHLLTIPLGLFPLVTQHFLLLYDLLADAHRPASWKLRGFFDLFREENAFCDWHIDLSPIFWVLIADWDALLG